MMMSRFALGWLSIVLAVVLGPRAGLAACSATRAAPEIEVEIGRTNTPAGEPVSLRWSSTAKDVATCRAPLFLVLATSARVRFSGDGFLAISPDTNGPYGIEERKGQTRVFIPLHALPPVSSGQLNIKLYSGGAQVIDWFVVAVPPSGEHRRPTVLAGVQSSLKIAVEGGRPIIVVRDSLNPTIATSAAGVERPRATLYSNSGEFELQVFDKFYRVHDVRSGEIVLERAGTHPNFSPSSRFIGAFAEGEGFEILDLFADAVVVSSARLNRSGGYEGTAHVAAWARGDAVLALSFWGWGGVYVQQTLVDGPGRGANASCHACQGIGVDLSVSLDTGFVRWFGQESGWASLFEPTGSQQALEAARKRFPGDNKYAEQAAFGEKLSAEMLSQLGARYLFKPPAPIPQVAMNRDVRDGSAWKLDRDALRLSHACTLGNDGRCSLGIQSDEGRAELAKLVSLRVAHSGRKRLSELGRTGPEPAYQDADARLTIARAAAGAGAAGTSNVWQRLAQLGVPVSLTDRVDLPLTSFSWKEAYDKPSLVTEPLLAKLPAIRQMLTETGDNDFAAPGYVDEQHEITKIIPQRVRQIANWRIGGTEYWLTHADYQTGNSSTPQDRYLHIISGNPAAGPSGALRIIDLSTRLTVDGTLARSVEQSLSLGHPWPTNIDLLSLVAERYLLASGQWLHDSERWALVYDLINERAIFFNGHLPNGTITSSIAITSDVKVFIATARNGQMNFWRMATGEHILSGAYIDDELVVYDADGYFVATYEGSQFVFLKFPSLPGYVPFKQFAKTLQRPDVIRAAFEGAPAPVPPSLTPPPRLRLAATPVAGSPGSVRVAISASATRPLDKLRLFIDGQLWREWAIKDRQIDLSKTVEVPAQSRWLTAVVIDASGSESVPVAEALPRDDRLSQRNLYAVAVGTDIYRLMPADLQLRYAVSDARNFLSAVKRQNSGYYAAVKTTELFDSIGLQTELPARLRALAKAATADDTIMLFASGHGYRAPDGKLYLLVAESDQTRLEETSLSWDELAQAFGETRARIIVFIDACHSGAVPNGGSNDEIADALNARQVRFTVVAAAKGRQESFERADLGGGVFTSAIVKAITDGNRSGIDTNHNGVIELTELYSQIKPAVLTQMGGQQTPWLARADMVGEIPLF